MSDASSGLGEERVSRYVAREAPPDFRNRHQVPAERPGAGAPDLVPPGGSASQATAPAASPTLPTTASGAAAGTPTPQPAAATLPTPGVPAVAAPAPAAPPGATPATAPPAPAAQNAAAQKPPASPADDPEKDELREVVLRLGQLAPNLTNTDPALSRTINALMRQMDLPGRSADAVYRTRVAYAVEDAEKLSALTPMPPSLRAELGRLGATYPGLQNDRMRELVASTPTIDNSGLVSDIRSTAIHIARQSDQTTPEANSRIDVLENRARFSLKVADPDQAPTTAGATSQSAAQGSAQAQVNGRQQQVPGGAPGVQATAQQRPGRVMLDIMTALRRPEPDTPAPWDRQLTPMGDRIAAYTAKTREGEEEQGFQHAAKSGQAALTAMKEFSDGPGSVLMARIRDAAKTDPHGMAGVMAEMREGGRYAGLRQDFNVALQQEKGFAAAYERAAGAVAKFDTDRVEVDKIAEARPDAAAIASRFQKLDAEIGKAASELPGKTEGKSFTDELTERAGEIVRKAVAAVANAFNRMRPTSGPSPS